MPPPLVFVVGDSISLGYGPYLMKLLEGVFCYDRKSGEEEALKNLDLPMGANGGNSTRVRTYLESMAKDPAWKPDFLLVNAGLHDIICSREDRSMQVPPELYEENLQAIVTLSEKNGLPLVWVLTTPVHEEIHRRMKAFDRCESDVTLYNICAEGIMHKAGIPTIDLYTMTRNLGVNETTTEDGVHFVPAVQAQQAAFLAGWLFAHANR